MQPAAQRRYINVFLSLGSNVGNRAANLASAFQHIQKEIGKVAKKSHLYETEPWGNKDQDAFYNQVIMVNTTLEPRDILAAITKIERAMGRERSEKWGPRIIDIDILFYGKRVIRDKGLEIPHPDLHKRGFILAPLLEIAPDYVHPILSKQIDELYMECEDPSDVIKLD